MSWQPPPQPLQVAFDDEEAGGTASWYEHVPIGSPLPEYNDWVWGPDRAQEDGGPRLPRTTRYLVVRRGWSFVQPLSVNGQSGKVGPARAGPRAARRDRQ